MNDPTLLPHLIRLLDDPDDLTRRSLSRELSAFGLELDGLLSKLPEPPSEQQKQIIQKLLNDYADDWLRTHWAEWKEPAEEKKKLEAGMEMLSFYLGGLQRARGELSRRLDALAKGYLLSHPQPMVFTLAEYLGVEQEFTGATHHVHSTQNSDLVHVLDSKRGLPISLAVIFMLVADRCNLAVEGCNNPGHFLAVARQGSELFLVDGFHGWQFFRVNSYLNADDPISGPVLRMIERGSPTSQILKRCLANLKHAFELEEDSPRVRLMEELRSGMPEPG